MLCEEAPMLLRETLFVRLFSLRVPLLLFLGPRVERLDDERAQVSIRLRWRSRNHLGSMYFGALCAGADLAGGLAAARLIRERHPRVSLVFGDVQGRFLKRADGDVTFTCADGRRIAEAVAAADAGGERVTIPVEVVATVPSRYADEPVARFTLGLSLKRR
jgi:acyl-coenzyme A thioesterase PaaI-like protein